MTDEQRKAAYRESVSSVFEAGPVETDGPKGEHTPTPWTLTPEPHASWIGAIGNNHDDPQLWSVATPYPKGNKAADAALIIEAVNNYESLRGVLEEAKEFIRTVVPHVGGHVLTKIDAALSPEKPGERKI